MPIFVGDNSDNHIDGGSGSDVIFGLEGNDSLHGREGNDVLIGGAGADELVGGIPGGPDSGIDAASYENATAGVIADLLFTGGNTGDAAGDTYIGIENLIGSDFDDGLGGDNGANIIFGGKGIDYIAGRGGNDTLFGGDGIDRMSGDAGADRFFGGNDFDFADYVTAPGSVGVDLETGGFFGEAAGDVYDSIEAATGSNFADNLRGDGVANLFYGLASNDLIDGRGGDDVLFGDAGYDNLVGGGGNDQLFGGGDSDALDGNAGADFMRGDAGNDDYFVDNAGDVVDEAFAGSSGTDEVIASIGFSLADPVAVLGAVEHLFLTGSADLNGAGNGLDNLIVGNLGNNVLSGGGGIDQLIGLDGNDILSGGAGVDVLQGEAGNDIYIVNAAGEADETDGGGIDTVRSTVSYVLGADLENLTLLGGGNTNGTSNALGNRIAGSAGNNTLTGGLGRDVMTGDAFIDMGGPGSDRFDFNATAESGVTAATRDVITDFNAGTSATSIDRIDVSTIDANALVSGNQAFLFGGAFVAGHIRVVQAGANVVLQFNTDADAAADMTITLAGLTNLAALDARDFVL